jgi:hypothetical protein
MPEKSDASAGSDVAILVLVRDLMFLPRITRAAADVGVSIQVVRDPSQLAGKVGRRLIVDLSLSGAIEAAAAWRADGLAAGEPASVTGFVGHTDIAIERAREAGIDRVMAKGAFTQQVEAIVAGRE